MLWNLLLIACYLSAVIHNLLSGVADPLLIKVPPEIWVLAGITNGTGLLAPLILRRGDPPKVDQAVSQLGSKEKESIAVKETSRDASIGDLFSGERGTDFQTVDVPRVQQLAFTAILAGTYALTALKLFRGAAPGSAIASLPEIGEGFIALLSISSTVYMGGKALPGLAQQMTGASEKTEDQASPTVAKASSSGGAVG